MRYKSVIFDLDGTLLNTLDDIRDSLNVALSKFGSKEKTLEEVRKAVGYASRELIVRTLDGGKENPELQDVLDFYLKYYGKHSRIKTKPYDGITELLCDLKAQGIRTAIVSNKPHEVVSVLKSEIFGELIDISIGESERLPRKPNPSMLVKAAEILGCAKEECVYVGDSEVDVLTAQNAGMDLIAVLWGFRTKDELIKSGAKKLAADAKELGRIIKQSE